MSSYLFQRNRQSGAISGLLVAVIGLSVLVLGLGSFGIWAYVSYNEAQGNVDDKIAIAVAQAREDKGNEDEAKYAEQIKQPNTVFKAPDDFCGVTFKYPKTWSAYESEQISNGSDYKVYFYPGVIPVVSNNQQYALRLVIEQKDYDTVVNQYQNLVQKGSLKSSSTASNGQQGTRLDGDFSKNIRGSAVIYRCRDKTISIFTDAETFKPDFETLIQTLDYNA